MKREEAIKEGLSVRKSMGLPKEHIGPEDLEKLEAEAREHFKRSEEDTKPSGRTAAGKAKRLRYQRDYQRKARKCRTLEQKRKQVAWNRAWRRKRNGT